MKYMYVVSSIFGLTLILVCLRALLLVVVVTASAAIVVVVVVREINIPQHLAPWL